jgi:signal transduction histidine kinase
MSRGRALVVDDDRHILEVVGMRLESMGLQVTAMHDPAEAARALGDERFDLALFDLRMEPLDGFMLLARARALQPNLPVLIMTAYATIDSAVRAIRDGAFDYVTKPFVSDELRTKIGRALAERRWTRDRALLARLGEMLGSGGTVEGLLDAVVKATVDATETEQATVFLFEGSRLVPRAAAPDRPPPDDELAAAAAAAAARDEPCTTADARGRSVLAAPLHTDGVCCGVLVAASARTVAPTADDLASLALFASQASAALQSSHELSRCRSGALTALGRVSTQVAHEINNPLGGLKIYAGLLESHLTREGDRHGADLARKIDQAIDRLANLASDITAFGRSGGELRRQPVELGDLVQDCLALVQDRVLMRRIRVVCGIGQQSGPVLLDADEIRKALVNLFVNAIEAMDAEGTLGVRADRDADGTVRIRIEDTGCGMDAATLARTFELFFTTKRTGTGLGMAAVRSVVERHGGTVTIESEPGRGTRVELRLPAS